MRTLLLTLCSCVLLTGASRCEDDETSADSAVKEGGGEVHVDAGATPSPGVDAGGIPNSGTGGAMPPAQDAGAGEEPDGVACGSNTCAAGEVCCNASCGICTEPDGACTQQFCEEPPADGGKQDAGRESQAGDPCDLTCETGERCEYVQVQCIRAPCPPLPQCVAVQTCGGIAGFACPGAGDCVDDPSDDCDPEQGGADCGGLCECNALGLCVDGKAWNSSPSVCGCE